MKYILKLALIFMHAMPTLHAQPNPTVEFAKGEKLTWTSKDHPKAKGIEMQISYPSTWKAAEGTRPNILQKFVGRSETGMDMMSITTRTLPAPFDKELSPEEKNEVLSEEGVTEMLPPDGKLLSHKITKIDGEPCAMVEFLVVSERAGMKIAQKGMFFAIVRPGTLILIQIATGADATKGMDALNARYESVKPLYTMIGSSCVFVDKWEE